MFTYIGNIYKSVIGITPLCSPVCHCQNQGNSCSPVCDCQNNQTGGGGNLGCGSPLCS